jgi:hypothetical protein
VTLVQERRRRARVAVQALESDYRAGDASALADAISISFWSGFLPPQWVQDAWSEGSRRVNSRECSWADVLGGDKPMTPKQLARDDRDGWQLAKLRRLLPTLREPINRSNDAPCWREIAGPLKTHPRQAKVIYYRLREMLGAAYMDRLRRR